MSGFTVCFGHTIMSQPWIPESHVRISDDETVIEIMLHGVFATSLALIFKEGQLRLHGQHKEFGEFESRFELPPNHNPGDIKAILENDVLRIEVPSAKRNIGSFTSKRINISGITAKPGEIAAFLGSKSHPMMIYCNGCEKHFDIVAGKGAREYRCPHCGKVQTFSLETLVNQAMEQSQKMLRKRGSR